MRARKTLRVLAALAALIVAAWLLLPWRIWVQEKLVRELTEKGIGPVTLTLDSIGLRGVTLKDVSLGDPPLTLSDLTLAYSPRQLLDGTIEEVELRGLTLTARQDAQGWHIAGIDGLLRSKESSSTKSTIPVTREELAAIPLQQVRVSESMLRIETPSWNIEAPVTLTLQRAQTITLAINSTGLTLHKGADTLTTGPFTLKLTLDESAKQWRGEWSLDAIALTSESLVLPALKAKGELAVQADSIALKGTAEDASRAYGGSFNLDYSLADSTRSRLTIQRAQLPWGGGKLSLSNARVPLGEKKPITLTLNVQQVAIDTLMQGITGDQATATGVVSGSVPLTITTDGEFRIGKAALKADAPGVISLSPQAIPGDNTQVALVRELLKNLHYTLLSLELETAPDRSLAALLTVEGKNPDVEGGRPIKLKVHLSGDLLNLITQNVKLMTDPKNFIQQEAQ